MAIHSIIEINHDKAHLWSKDPKFGINLYNILADKLSYNVKKQILNNYGIRFLNQHHSSENFEVVNK